MIEKKQNHLQHDGSFFKRIAGLTEKYDLSPPEDILLLNKESWEIISQKDS